MNEPIVKASPSSLMDLTRTWQWLEWKLTETGGEMDQELDRFYTEIAHDLPKKIDSYDHIMGRIAAAEEFMRSEASRFVLAARALKNHGERLRDTLKAVMASQDMKELQGNRVRFRLTDVKPSLEIDESKLPKAFWTETVLRTPNKEMIRAVLETGETVPGAELIHGKALRSYVGGAK